MLLKYHATDLHCFDTKNYKQITILMPFVIKQTECGKRTFVS